MPRRRRVTKVLAPHPGERVQIFTMAEIAAMLGWSTRKTRRWLTSNGAAQRRGHGRGLWITTPNLLMAHFPEVFHALGRVVSE